MSNYKLTHHQVISSALQQFNKNFLSENNIIFGGGTRIALEIDEYRESIDIDFLCPNKESYRSVREQVTNTSLGKLVQKDFSYPRDIVFDRYAVRSYIVHKDVQIKLEFVSFDNYKLEWVEDTTLFPVPFLDKESCFYTKLLANSDRKMVLPYKDILDLLAMRIRWGEIPVNAIDLSIEHYGRESIVSGLIMALEDIIDKPSKYLSCATDLSISPSWADKLIKEYPVILLSEINKYNIG